MEQEILQIIKEKLPAIQAQAIADFVAEARKIERERDYLDKNRIVQEKVYNKTKDEIKILRNKLEAVIDIETREQAVKDAEKQIAVDAQSLKGEVEKRQLAVEMFRVVFANAQIKREIFGMTPVPSGEYGITTTQQSKTETITAE